MAPAKKTRKTKTTIVKAIPAIVRAFGLEKARDECLYYEIYDGRGHLFKSGCIDNGCKNELDRTAHCEKDGERKRCACLLGI